jgi:hypothetical protein
MSVYRRTSLSSTLGLRSPQFSLGDRRQTPIRLSKRNKSEAESDGSHQARNRSRGQVFRNERSSIVQVGELKKLKKQFYEASGRWRFMR